MKRGGSGHAFHCIQKCPVVSKDPQQSILYLRRPVNNSARFQYCRFMSTALIVFLFDGKIYSAGENVVRIAVFLTCFYSDLFGTVFIVFNRYVICFYDNLGF